MTTPDCQACDFVGYYVIYVNISKIEVIHVNFFLEVIMLFSWKGGVFIFLCEMQKLTIFGRITGGGGAGRSKPAINVNKVLVFYWSMAWWGHKHLSQPHLVKYALL